MSWTYDEYAENEASLNNGKVAHNGKKYFEMFSWIPNRVSTNKA